MNQRLLLGWAIAATLVAVGTSGYIVGKRAGSAPTVAEAPRPATEQPTTSEPGATRDALPAYVVPDSLAAAPREWRTSGTSDFSGYVALFDPTAREVIVEQCRHSGYPVDANGRPGQPLQNFCTRVLTGWLETVAERSAQVTTRDGQTITLSLAADLDGDRPQLELEFGEHQVTLVPGSKNDLLQAIEREPEIVAQKQRYLLAMHSRPESGADADRSGDRTH